MAPLERPFPNIQAEHMRFRRSGRQLKVAKLIGPPALDGLAPGAKANKPKANGKIATLPQAGEVPTGDSDRTYRLQRRFPGCALPTLAGISARVDRTQPGRNMNRTSYYRMLRKYFSHRTALRFALGR